MPSLQPPTNVSDLGTGPLDQKHLAYIGNIPHDVRKGDFLEFLYDAGFSDIQLHWPPGEQDMVPKDWQHLGHCVAEFPSVDLENQAMNRIPALRLRGAILCVSSAESRLNPTPIVDGPNRCDLVRMKETLKSLKYPPEYTSTAVWGKNDVEYATKLRMAHREKEDGTSLLVAYDDAKDNLRVRCQPVPSPMEFNDKHRNKTWIYVTSPKGAHITKRITLDQLPMMKAEGWKEFHVAKRLLEEGTDHDLRKISMIQDVYSTDNPVDDTLRMFQTGVAISEKSDGVTWTPESLLTLRDGAQAVVSTSETFIGPNDHKHSHLSATSQGHHVKYPRPAKVGPGWGDYDHYADWQQRGRKVTSDMVPNKLWNNSMPEKVQFEIITDGEPIPGDIVTTTNKKFDEQHGEKISNPVGLWERLSRDEARQTERAHRFPKRK